jgi:hypothetical protein
MSATVSVPHDGGVEIASSALNNSVIEYLRSVQSHAGADAFDKVAADLVTDVCAVLAVEFGPEGLFELFDRIEAAQAASSSQVERA